MLGVQSKSIHTTPHQLCAVSPKIPMNESCGERTRLLAPPPPECRNRTPGAVGLPVVAQPGHHNAIGLLQQTGEPWPSRRARFWVIGITGVFALGLINAISSKSAERDALVADVSSRANAAAIVGDLSLPAGGLVGGGGHGLLDIDATADGDGEIGHGRAAHLKGGVGTRQGDGIARGGGSTTEKQGNGGSSRANGKSKPNVFFILMDDMGWNDIGYQSTDLWQLTPNLDRLASKGIKLKQYYTLPVCTPARASIMTGRYPIRYGLQYKVISAGAAWGLPTDEKILPQYMNDAGYESHMVGKWHLGSYQEEVLPHRRGFDTYLGYLNGEQSYWTHKSFEAEVWNNYFFDFGFGNETSYYDVNHNMSFLDNATRSNSWSPLSSSATPHEIEIGNMFDVDHRRRRLEELRQEEDEAVEEDRRVLFADGGGYMPFTQVDEGSMSYDEVYSEDIFLGRANRIISGRTPWEDKPLFLYLAHQSVHSPIASIPHEWFTDEEVELLANVNSTADERYHFAVSLLYVDKTIGFFIDQLEDQGWLENSVIVFASDNGGCSANGGTSYPLRGGKQSMFEGGTRVPSFVYSRSHIPEDLWGTVYDKMMHSTDWAPTLVSAAGGTLTGGAGALDGIDHWASLTSLEGHAAAEGPRTEILYNMDQYIMSSLYGLRRNDNRAQGAFRSGKWKLIINGWCSGYFSFNPEDAGDPMLDSENLCGKMTECVDCHASCEENTEYRFRNWLFNLEDDPRETTDLLNVYPEKAAELMDRANEVVYSDCVDSGYLSVDNSSYLVWMEHGWWMVPWVL